MLSNVQLSRGNSQQGRKAIATLLVLIFVTSGCLSNGDSIETDPDSTDEKIPETELELDKENNDIEEEVIHIDESEFCDDTNTDHCMLPFPSGAFLSVDSSEITGYRLSIDGEAIPDTSSAAAHHPWAPPVCR